MNIAENFRAALSGIDDARLSRTVARDEKITLIAVTKNHSVDFIRDTDMRMKIFQRRYNA